MAHANEPPDLCRFCHSRPISENSHRLCENCDENAAEYLDADASLFGAASELRSASQRLYDALQLHVDIFEADIRQELVAAMDSLRAVWHKADDTSPTSDDQLA